MLLHCCKHQKQQHLRSPHKRYYFTSLPLAPWLHSHHFEIHTPCRSLTAPTLPTSLNILDDHHFLLSGIAEKAKVSNITSKAGGQVFTCLIQVLIQAGRHNVNLKRQFDLKMVNATTLPATCHVGATSEVTTHLSLKPLIIQYPPPTHTHHIAVMRGK